MTTFQGQLYWRGDDGYEQERVGPIFNERKPNRYPAAILKAAHEQDVIAAVQLARERGLKISVRSGGHSWAAWSVRDDALLIDLASMREISLPFSLNTGLCSPAATVPPSASEASCCKGEWAGTAGAGAGPARASRRSMS